MYSTPALSLRITSPEKSSHCPLSTVAETTIFDANETGAQQYPHTAKQHTNVSQLWTSNYSDSREILLLVRPFFDKLPT
jgi:hypothetical protein